MHGALPDESGTGSQLKQWIKGSTFTCLAAKASVKRQVFQYAELGTLGTDRTTHELHSSLENFITQNLTPNENFASFAAVFSGPVGIDENEFEKITWQQLSSLHEYDNKRYTWASESDNDPASANFAFSVAGHPLFIVGLHANSSRVSRRFTLPTLVFNSHRQFARLKETGIYAGLQRRIRERERRLQGDINPNLGEFGEISEARQYSGRAVEPDWQCPFTPRPGRVAQETHSDS
ncbi:guanitoxin biosynthesis heme-dependent pre-guanitoxin N-hydroxylase GntA [Streptomyces sp. 8L]|uniref:guanitoxin biosynthesis heme-dependent pre-guanitoxin N-hydroxylase GntA n=1 Tax=Streptomyces sp. 8L TaxID=2877242 RepID=UPI001CD63773|nr:guanitoxin biosynthesis heme-dependent pre-guanitoxin N-hydroxylase GntA [Streptomyces sp. 8L]MCA1222842.1 YqcI/YcgG family protein [Streptomyces sp. 8L]